MTRTASAASAGQAGTQWAGLNRHTFSCRFVQINGSLAPSSAGGHWDVRDGVWGGLDDGVGLFSLSLKV
jgi:hypothetical protein